MCQIAKYLFLGRLLRDDLIKWVSNVRPSTKSFFDFNDIRYVGRGRRLIHDDMQYDPIQGQGQGHEPSKVGNSAIFNGPHFISPHGLAKLGPPLPWGLANDHGYLN